MISPPFRKPWIRAWNVWIITKLLKKSLTNLLFIMLNTWSFVKNFTSKPIYSSNRIIGNKSQKNRSIYNKKPLILKNTMNTIGITCCSCMKRSFIDTSLIGLHNNIIQKIQNVLIIWTFICWKERLILKKHWKKKKFKS